MRRSELTGLQWKHIDLDNKKLTVALTLQRISGHGLVQGPPKSGQARAISLTADNVALLRRIRITQTELRLAYGGAWIDCEYVFTQPNGNPIDSNYVSRGFKRLVDEFLSKNEDVPSIKFHGLRSAHVTMLIAEGADIYKISRRLGHSSIQITLDVYGHLLPDGQDSLVEAIDNAMAKAFV